MIVYLDHSATTPVDPEVLDEMRPYFNEQYGNPSALYRLGQAAHQAVDLARERIATAIGAQPDTIYFTGNATESCNLAILGLAKAYRMANGGHYGHIITTKIDHKAVLAPLARLEEKGFQVTYLDVDAEGRIDLKELAAAIKEDTFLVSIIWGSNEIGTIQPMADIGRLILKHRKKHKTAFPYLHTDACQVAGYLDLSVEKTHVDFMTINSSKIYGPKGMSALYRRRGVPVEPIMYGGGQQDGLRSGTENVPGIVGFASALEQVQAHRTQETARVQDVAQYFWKRISAEIPDVRLVGPPIGEERLPHHLYVLFDGVEAEALVLYLDAYGIICSTGSACTASSDKRSHVLPACGYSPEDVFSGVRLTLGKGTTKEAIDYVMTYLPSIVSTLRDIHTNA